MLYLDFNYVVQYYIYCVFLLKVVRNTHFQPVVNFKYLSFLSISGLILIIITYNS